MENILFKTGIDFNYGFSARVKIREEYVTGRTHRFFQRWAGRGRQRGACWAWQGGPQPAAPQARAWSCPGEVVGACGVGGVESVLVTQGEALVPEEVQQEREGGMILWNKRVVKSGGYVKSD